MLYRWIICAGWLTLVDANPSCKIYGSLKMAVVCKHEGSDYTLTRGLVSDRNITRKIVLRNCGISQIDQESFENLPTLRHLDLSQNTLKLLELGIFDGLSMMNHLNLSYNSIKTIPLGLFDQNPNILNLDFSRNTLTELQLGILDPLKKLIYLNFSGNSLIGKEMTPYLLDQSPDVRILDLSRNDMSTSPENLLHALHSLELLNVSAASLTDIPKFSIEPNLWTIKRLVLSSNQIRIIDDPTTFVNLVNLEILELNNNMLDFINENVFTPLKKVKGIYLRNNKLKEISVSLFQNLPNLINLELAQNYIESFNVDILKGTTLKNLNLSSNKLAFMPENFCSRLKSMGVSLKKFFFNPNPWQCACLNELLQEVKSFNIDYNSHFFDGERSICTVSERFVCNRS